jgi:hypothetical protein
VLAWAIATIFVAVFGTALGAINPDRNAIAMGLLRNSEIS